MRAEVKIITNVVSKAHRVYARIERADREGWEGDCNLDCCLRFHIYMDYAFHIASFKVWVHSTVLHERVAQNGSCCGEQERREEVLADAR